MAKKEFKIGETFQYENVKLKVEKAKDLCSGCHFYENGLGCTGEIEKTIGDCTLIGRKDEQDVIFVKVEE